MNRLIKYLFAILLLVLFQTLEAQEEFLQNKITLQFKDAPLHDVLKEILQFET